MAAMIKKNPDVDLKLKYRKVLETSLVVSLMMLVILFFSFKQFETTTQLPESPDIQIEVIDIPPTEQISKPPPPSRPSIPIEAEDDELLDDVTIEDTEIIFDAPENAPPPPPPEDDEVFEFFAVSDKPVMLKQAKPDYPDLARKAQIEGIVVVTVTIGKTGKVEKAVIFKSIPMLDEEALLAAKKCVFKPAKQRDKFVRVKMNIPFNFRLK
ncbi:MAG: energy transducer TonB [Calditrichia bacterium]|nr:energy transducer TonB [Calditrichia bacterium]